MGNLTKIYTVYWEVLASLEKDKNIYSFYYGPFLLLVFELTAFSVFMYQLKFKSV